jgi:uncharacterized protein
MFTDRSRRTFTAALTVVTLDIILPVARAQSVEDDFAVAAQNDRVQEAKRLLAAGADPDLRDRNGDPVLVIAARAGSTGMVDLLLGTRVNVNAKTNFGDTALMMAALGGRLEIAKKLRARGADVNQPGWTPLMYAAAGGRDEVVRYLLAEGGEIDALSPNGTTALMMAAREGKRSTAELLIARGADVNRRNQSGVSALDLARRAKEPALVERLQQAGAR